MSDEPGGKFRIGIGVDKGMVFLPLAGQVDGESRPGFRVAAFPCHHLYGKVSIQVGSHLQLNGVRGTKFLVRQGNRCSIGIRFSVLYAQFPTKGQNLALAQRASIFLCVFWLEEQGTVLQEQLSFFLVLNTAQAMQTGLCALHRIVDLWMVKPYGILYGYIEIRMLLKA